MMTDIDYRRMLPVEVPLPQSGRPTLAKFIRAKVNPKKPWNKGTLGVGEPFVSRQVTRQAARKFAKSKRTHALGKAPSGWRDHFPAALADMKLAAAETNASLRQAL